MIWSLSVCLTALTALQSTDWRWQQARQARWCCTWPTTRLQQPELQVRKEKILSRWVCEVSVSPIYKASQLNMRQEGEKRVGGDYVQISTLENGTDQVLYSGSMAWNKLTHHFRHEKFWKILSGWLELRVRRSRECVCPGDTETWVSAAYGHAVLETLLRERKNVRRGPRTELRNSKRKKNLQRPER